MVAVQRSARPTQQFPNVVLDLSAFGAKTPFTVPNLADPTQVPGQIYVIAFSDGFDSSVAQVTAFVGEVVSAFPELGRFLRKLTVPDWSDIMTAWLEASKEGLTVDPKGSSSSTNS